MGYLGFKFSFEVYQSYKMGNNKQMLNQAIPFS
jgi:hypothetical protein